MDNPSVADYQRLGTERDVTISRAQLPLHCPLDNAASWCSHPKVFLAIEKAPDLSSRCPYCGTLYRLVD